MNFYGIKANKIDLAKNYLPIQPFYHSKGRLIGPNPNEFYAGYPWSKSGWFCYAKPIVKAGEKYFEKNSLNYSIKDFSKKTLDDFEAEIKKGNLVLAWVTLEMQNVKKVYKWHRSDTMEKELVPRNLHCVVIKGIKNNKVFYVDPITGHKSINKNVFINRYRQIGSYAVLVGKTETMMQNTSKSTAVEISSDFIIKTGDNYSNIKNLEFDRKNVYISLDRLFYLFSNKKRKCIQIRQ